MADKQNPDKQDAGKPGGGSGAKPNPKVLAAQARAETEAAERRRERMIRIIGAIVVVIVVAGLIAVGVMAGRSKDQATAAPTANPSAPVPSGVQTTTYGVPIGTGWTAENADKLPTLEIWEDFQCPACKQVEDIAGASIVALANEGKVKLLLRPTTFLDNNLNNDSSVRSTAAWGCAIDAGKAEQYHSGIFAIQPPTEGTGYTDEQLQELAKQVGITDAAFDTFEKCMADGTYKPWAANSTKAFEDAAVKGTPTAFLNGTELSGSDLADVEGLQKKIKAATAS